MHLTNNLHRRHLTPILLTALVCLSGCAARPSAAVLNVTQVGPVHKEVTVLSATNRKRLPGNGYGSDWAQSIAYESYSLSVPPSHKISAIEYPASKPDPLRQFVVFKRQDLSEAGFVSHAANAIQADGTVSIFVHGYDNSFQEALFRTAQTVADSGVSDSVLFSWPSKASVTAYAADRAAVLNSRHDLQSVVTALASNAKIKKVAVFGHSMGGFLVMEVVRQLKLEHRDDIIHKLNVMLASPDIDVDVFRSQLKEIGRLPTPITMFTSKVDIALEISSLLAGGRPRVGLLDINDPAIRKAALDYGVRIVDISAVNDTAGGGHDRFATLAQFALQFEAYDRNRSSSVARVGAFVLAAPGAAVASPSRIILTAVRSR